MTTHVTIGEGAIVCKSAKLVGQVVIGNGCVVHPHATVDGSIAAVRVGEMCIVEEFSCLQNTSGANMTIGSHSVFEVGCVVDSSSIGSGTIIHAKAKVDAGCVIGDGCVIGMGVQVPSGSVIDNNTVLYIDAFHRRVVDDLKQRNLKLCSEEVELVSSLKLLENHHPLRESGVTNG